MAVKKKKPAKPSVRKPAKPVLRKPAKPPARKKVARKTVARKPVARKATVRKTTATATRSAAPKPSTPLVTPPQGINTGGTPQPQQPLGSFYHQVEQPMATHTVKEGETLSHIALRYYGDASEKFSNHIYNANRAKLTDGPNMIQVGQELTIPKPPAD